MQRSEALQKAEQLINGARARTHGDAKDTHESIALSIISDISCSSILKWDLVFIEYVCVWIKVENAIIDSIS